MIIKSILLQLHATLEEFGTGLFAFLKEMVCPVDAGQEYFTLCRVRIILVVGIVTICPTKVAMNTAWHGLAVLAIS